MSSTIHPNPSPDPSAGQALAGLENGGSDDFRSPEVNDSKPEDPSAAVHRSKKTRALGDQLRRLYEDVAREPVPDDFMRLLEDADRSKSGHGKNGSDKGSQ